MKNEIMTTRYGLLGLSLTALLACSSQTSDSVTPDDQNTVYKDGVYTATGEYGNLPSHITVTVTLQNNLITDTSVQPHATDPTSLDYQRRFAEAVPAVVKGKPIGEVNVGRLAGSSGTPRGFNDAINQIKQQATKR